MKANDFLEVSGHKGGILSPCARDKEGHHRKPVYNKENGTKTP